MQYFPCFQPIIDINRMSITGYEALARTLASDGQVIAVGELLSDSSFNRADLLAIDCSVREQALAHFAKSQQSIFLSLKLSPDWMDHISDDIAIPTIEIAQRLDIDPTTILIEFVEGAGENIRMQKLLARYRAAGMRVAIDDFGADVAQLSRILALTPDIIKLDVSLCKAAMVADESQQFMQSMSLLAQCPASQLLCEGVTTEQQFYFALECGARYMQGCFFWPALPDFVDANSPKTMISNLLGGLVKRKFDRESQKIRYMEEMVLYFLLLQSAIKGNVLEFDALSSAPSGFLRIFLCRHNGEQISPNYELTNDPADRTWLINREYIGFNWSMRPYFYQALATNKKRSKSHVVSRPYRDITSGRLCQTIAKMLTSDRILFADILCFDEDDRGSHDNSFYLR